MKGFLITTNGNEGKAVLEAYSLLNEVSSVYHHRLIEFKSLKAEVLVYQ